LCTQETQITSLFDAVDYILRVNSDAKNMKDIIDDLEGYPKIYNFTLQMKSDSTDVIDKVFVLSVS
jgi:hypothetical protein